MSSIRIFILILINNISSLTTELESALALNIDKLTSERIIWKPINDWETFTIKQYCPCIYKLSRNLPDKLQKYIIDSRDYFKTGCLFNSERGEFRTNVNAIEGIKQYKDIIFDSINRHYLFSLAISGSSISAADFFKNSFNKEIIDSQIEISSHLSIIYKGLVEHFINFINLLKNTPDDKDLCNVTYPLFPKEIIENITSYVQESSNQENLFSLMTVKSIEYVKNNTEFQNKSDSEMISQINTKINSFNNQTASIYSKCASVEKSVENINLCVLISKIKDFNEYTKNKALIKQLKTLVIDFFSGDFEKNIKIVQDLLKSNSIDIQKYVNDLLAFRNEILNNSTQIILSLQKVLGDLNTNNNNNTSSNNTNTNNSNTNSNNNSNTNSNTNTNPSTSSKCSTAEKEDAVNQVLAKIDNMIKQYEPFIPAAYKSMISSSVTSTKTSLYESDCSNPESKFTKFQSQMNSYLAMMKRRMLQVDPLSIIQKNITKNIDNIITLLASGDVLKTFGKTLEDLLIRLLSSNPYISYVSSRILLNIVAASSIIPVNLKEAEFYLNNIKLSNSSVVPNESLNMISFLKDQLLTYDNNKEILIINNQNFPMNITNLPYNFNNYSLNVIALSNTVKVLQTYNNGNVGVGIITNNTIKDLYYEIHNKAFQCLNNEIQCETVIPPSRSSDAYVKMFSLFRVTFNMTQVENDCSVVFPLTYIPDVFNVKCIEKVKQENSTKKFYRMSNDNLYNVGDSTPSKRVTLDQAINNSISYQATVEAEIIKRNENYYYFVDVILIVLIAIVL